MILIIGLGNPGKKYEKTRHNIGFRVIDEIIKSQSASWRTKVKSQNLIFLKPGTFMNESGKAVQKTLAYYKAPVSNLIVIHDDIDLSLGVIRVSKNSSSGGHKGVQSIIDELKTKNFTRIRVGIRPKFKIDTEKYVLQKFTKEEEKIVSAVIKKVVESIRESLRTGIKKTTISIPCPTHERQIFSQE